MPSAESNAPAAADLTRALASLYRLTVDARARPEARRTMRIVFDAPLSRSAARRLAVAVGARGDIGLLGTFVGADSVLTAGRAGRGGRVAGLIDSLYGDQLDSATALRRDLVAGARGDRSMARAVADIDRYRTMLRRRGPFVSGFVADVNAAQALAATVAANSRITSLIAPETDANAATRTLRAAVRENADERRSARAPAAARAAQSLAPSAYMPSTWLARTYPTGPRNRFGHHVKQTSLFFRWNDASRLAYYQGAEARTRGFEAQSRPVSATPWSTNWYDSDSWSSNMPRAYKDDIASDGSHPVFAIGSGNARALTANKAYWASFKTEAGAFNTTDEGSAQLSGQAVHRASSAGELAYCIPRGGTPSHCFFGTATAIVGTYPLDRKFHAFK